MTESNKNTDFLPDKFPGVIERIEITDKHVAKIEVPSRYAEGLRAAKERGGVYIFLCYPLSSPEQVVSAMESEEFGAMPRISSETNPQTSGSVVDVETLANLLDMTERNVQLQVDNQLLVRPVGIARGQYDMLASYVLLWKAYKNLQTGQGDKLNHEKLEGARLKRQTRELDYYERAGKLGNIEIIQRVIEKAKAAEKQQVLFMPKQLAPRLEGTPAEREAILEEWAYSFLKAQTEINLSVDLKHAPKIDQDKMPEMKKQKKKRKRK